jgi:hypothetical protein
MSMIPKKPVPDLIRDGNRFSEKDHARKRMITLPSPLRAETCIARGAGFAMVARKAEED